MVTYGTDSEVTGFTILFMHLFVHTVYYSEKSESLYFHAIHAVKKLMYYSMKHKHKHGIVVSVCTALMIVLQCKTGELVKNESHPYDRAGDKEVYEIKAGYGHDMMIFFRHINLRICFI